AKHKTGTVNSVKLTISSIPANPNPNPTPQAGEALPDMVMQPPSDISIGSDSTTNHKIVEFSITYANLGKGPLSFRGKYDSTGKKETLYQEIFKLKTDSHGAFKSFDFSREVSLGQVHFTDDQSGETRFKDWGVSSLLDESWNPAPGAVGNSKTTFSVMDVT